VAGLSIITLVFLQRVTENTAARIDRAILVRQNGGVKLLDQYEAACKVRRLRRAPSRPTSAGSRKFLRDHHDRRSRWVHPQEMSEAEVEPFLTRLAVNRRVVESTQNQALGAILFLYRDVVRKDLGSLDAVRAGRSGFRPRFLPRQRGFPKTPKSPLSGGNPMTDQKIATGTRTLCQCNMSGEGGIRTPDTV
jgi:hypothetical protein